MNKFDLLNNDENNKLINKNVDTIKNRRYKKRNYVKNNLEVDVNILSNSESDYDLISSNETKENINEDKGFKYIYSKKKKKYYKKYNNRSDSEYSTPNTNNSTNTEEIIENVDDNKISNNIIKRLDILNIDKDDELSKKIIKISDNINIVNIISNESENNIDEVNKINSNEISNNKWDILLNILYNKLLSIRYNNLLYYNERINEREKIRKELLEFTYELDKINNVRYGSLYDTVINHFGGLRRPISKLAYRVGEKCYNKLREMMIIAEENITKYDTIITITSESFLMNNFTTDIKLRWNISDRYIYCFSSYNELIININNFFKDISEIIVSNNENKEDNLLKIYILIKLNDK
jgi:hypothetical protein